MSMHQFAHSHEPFNNLVMHRVTSLAIAPLGSPFVIMDIGAVEGNVRFD